MSTQPKPTVVLVHGAFADSSSWNGVIKLLLAQGYPIISAANPLRGVKIDSDYLASVVDSVKGPVVLVGHSYGGMLISNVTNSNVQALVFVSAYAPEIGENAGTLTAQFPGSTLGPTLYSAALPNGDNDLYIQQDKFWAQFAADVPESDAKLMAATQRPVVASAFNDAATASSWKTRPSFFVFAELDKNIPLALHRFMAQRASAVQTFEVPGASHVVMVSHPDVAANAIVAAAEAILVPA